MRVNYQPLDDTPDKVEAAIRKYQELSGLDKNTEAYRRAYARNLMEQADALLRWGEQDEAERLAGRAAGMQIVYGPFEQKPQDLLERIAAMRRQGGGRQRAAAGRAPGYASASARAGADRCRAPAGRGVGPPGARGDRRRATRSGRIARPSGRTTAAARLGLCAGRRSSGTGVAGPAAVAAARVVGRRARRRTVRRAGRRQRRARPHRHARRLRSDQRPDAERAGVEPAAGAIGPDLRLAQNPGPAAAELRRAAGAAAGPERRRRAPRRRAWRCSSRAKRP